MEGILWRGCGKGKKTRDITASPLGAEWNSVQKFAVSVREREGQKQS